ncbi:MAG: hypothetical protein DRN66_02130 [Candidatus Nanohalarchaeota archaeon]|nr:MAG: hypothetical protein DRN66_02130 [Candidatus Nanohaloarchaeota archaeon]
MEFGLILMYCVAIFGLFSSFFFLLVILESRNNLSNPKLKKFKKVTVVVPAYNEEKTIKKTLDSLLKLDWPKSKIQIIVVDDGSTDSTSSIVTEYMKKGIALIIQENKGKGSAMNTGLKNAEGEFFACLDADSVVERDALKTMIGFFEDDSVMAVTPTLKLKNPTTWLDKIQNVEYIIGIYLRKTFSIINALNVTPGPFTIYRKWFFDKYGGYDEKNLTEDMEIAMRIQKHHYKIENSLGAYVYTKPASTFSALMKQRIRWYKGALDNFINYRSLFSKDYGDFGVILLPSCIISVALVEILCAYLVVKNIIEYTKNAINWYYIGFDFQNLFTFNFNWFMFTFRPLIILTAVGFFLGIAIILISKKISNEKEHIKISYILYLVFYLFLFGLWWAIAIYYKITGKKIKWGKNEL